MFSKDPVLVHDIFSQVYEFTCKPRYGSHNRADAFLHERTFARETLRRIARYQNHDPFNQALYEVWQLVYDKPWTRPVSTEQLIEDLADAIQRGWLFAYTELSGLAGAAGHADESGRPVVPGSSA